MNRWTTGGVALAAIFTVQGLGTTFAQAIIGDIDGNHEVSLSDVSGFVGCLSGPGTPSLDLLCSAAMFDEDDDVDLRDVAGFQNRLGFGVGPPRIDRFWPPPGEWIVDDVGLSHVEVGFSEPVIVPENAIKVWVVGRLNVDGGDVRDFTTKYDHDFFVLTMTFMEPLRHDLITVVIDYTIEDRSERQLDGEIYDPHNAKLPSGNGINGGQGVFRIKVLQGDANRDGIVDMADSDLVMASLGQCDGDAAFNSAADLNGDGCVTAADADIVSKALGRELPAADGQAPTIVSMRANGAFGSFEELWIDFDQILRSRTIGVRHCFLTQADGAVIVPEGVAQGGFGYSVKWTFSPAMDHCNLYKINVSNALSDLSGELLVLPPPCTCLEGCPPFDETP